MYFDSNGNKCPDYFLKYLKSKLIVSFMNFLSQILNEITKFGFNFRFSRRKIDEIQERELSYISKFFLR